MEFVKRYSYLDFETALEKVEAGEIKPTFELPAWFGKQSPRERAEKLWAELQPKKIDVSTLSPEQLAKIEATTARLNPEEEPAMSKYKEAAEAIAKAIEHEEADDRAAVNFEKRINEIMKRDECKRRVAMETAAMEYPEDYERWQTGAGAPA
jgi:hypothetical protein